jgi:hypothetical protein
MRRIAASVLVFASALGATIAVGPAYANSDDVKWIAKCVSDNSDQGQSAQVISAYCTCMNDKMSSSETLSITAWEKSHPAEQEACSKQANWK